jgi:hypothetical protein
MKLFSKTPILFSLLAVVLLNGCTSSQVVSVSDTHLYNDQYGVIPNAHVDAIIEHEILAQNVPAEVDKSVFMNNPSYSEEIGYDPEAVTLENYVAPEPVITYKYMHSSTFFTEDELPENKLIMSNAIVD